jgi:hypothetical protein
MPLLRSSSWTINSGLIAMGPALGGSERLGQLPITRVVSRGRRNTGSKSTRGSFKTQGLSGPLIQAQGYFVQVRLREARQIGFFG